MSGKLHACVLSHLHMSAELAIFFCVQLRIHCLLSGTPALLGSLKALVMGSGLPACARNGSMCQHTRQLEQMCLKAATVCNSCHMFNGCCNLRQCAALLRLYSCRETCLLHALLLPMLFSFFPFFLGGERSSLLNCNRSQRQEHVMSTTKFKVQANNTSSMHLTPCPDNLLG